MTDYVLEIILLSPLTSAAGEGRIGLVDCDVAYDDAGLPILPGRRLKGLWREAYRDVVDAAGLCGQELKSAAEIFGEAGQRPNDGAACLHVGNAELHIPDASSLREWLDYLRQESNLHLDDVMQHFATLRSQTSIDRQTGVALENTFRITRTLKAGFLFRAPVHFVEPPTDTVLESLVLGAAALQRMGTARTRGLGKVSCRFICGLTHKVLDSNLLSSITVECPEEPSQVSTSAPVDADRKSEEEENTIGGSTDSTRDLNCVTPTHLLRYRLTLREAAVLPSADGDPNTVVTRQEVSGSVILGAAAGHYLRPTDKSPEDADFRHAFLDGGLRFLTAYPEVQAENEAPQRTIPIPHSVRKFKEGARDPEDERILDFVDFANPLSDAEKKMPKKRLDRRYAMIVPEEDLKTQAVKTERNYHHARAGEKTGGRSIGRALGNNIADGGAFFQYEALKAGQVFQGAVLGAADDLEKLQEWVSTGSLINIGRSRSAQYGETKFEWIDSTPQELKSFVEWEGFSVFDEPEPPLFDDSLVITTLSPLLRINTQGHPDTGFPEDELAEVLGLKACDLKLSCSYTRTEVIGGYHAHLRLPRQQWPAIDAGSVFVFSLKEMPDEERLLKLEQEGLGIQKGEGYGRVAVNRQGWLDLKYRKEQLVGSRAERPGTQVPSDVHNLLCNVARNRCLAEMQWRAIAAAERTQNIPNNALLGRLRLFLQQPAADAIEILDKLRKPAEEKLKKCQIDTSVPETLWLQADPVPLTLYGLFRQAWTKPDILAQDVIETCVHNLVDLPEADIREAIIKTLTETDSVSMCKFFLDCLLTALHRKSRRAAISTQ